MSDPVWNRIEFDHWAGGGVSVQVNPFGEGPVVLEIEGDGYETYDLSHWMTPDEARDLGSKLIEAAEATERAGLHADVGGPSTS